MSGNEIFKNIKPFLKRRSYRKFYCFARGVYNDAFHSGHLRQLAYVSAGTGIKNHKDGIFSVHSHGHELRHFFFCSHPNFYGPGFPFLKRKQAVHVVSADFFHFNFCFFYNSGFFFWNDYVVHAPRNSGPRREIKSKRFYIVQNLNNYLPRESMNHLACELDQTLSVHNLVHVRKLFGKNIVKKYAPDGCFHKFASGFSKSDFYFRAQIYFSKIKRQDCLIRGSEHFTFSVKPGIRVGRHPINSQNHVLLRIHDCVSSGGLQKIF